MLGIIAGQLLSLEGLPETRLAAAEIMTLFGESFFDRAVAYVLSWGNPDSISPKLSASQLQHQFKTHTVSGDSQTGYAECL